jgi:hypothetical protein
MPDKAKAVARQAFLVARANTYLSIVMVFFMGAAKQLSHVREIAASAKKIDGLRAFAKPSKVPSRGPQLEHNLQCYLNLSC